MAVPMTADQWLAALRAEGVTDIVEMPGWRTHNRGQRGDGWGDVHATMIHHTAGEGSGLPAWCYNGNTELPGPLCHDYLDRTGRVYLVGNGRANHAGMVAANAYDAVLNERSEHPAPGPDARDGNAVSYGLECENDGSPGRSWPAVQYDTAVRIQAARCRHHGWSADSVWAHKEATRRKPADPRLDMDDFRTDVAERLRHPASWNPGDKPTTPTPPVTPRPTPEEKPVALPTQDLSRIALAVLGYREKKADEKSKAAGRRIPDVYGYIVGTFATVQGIAADLKKVIALLNSQKEK
ncbi:N-acetylmuramoyl-L-alanine amidase [Streptomyces sp. NBC_00233]|uniref:peptidoglycan recognition protein family protein n=1 Tax=Streptomyces sp. NBC_00233 TaxID=2975686 RepID=UPI00225A7274|nr:N-acetylmuramoyl-L-alanine amidase [Streptomyces sp. NBC_00233]MCX5229662.1 N-acetylmuramoyl-L-alanine amidase [Streptomyces sp. NBC_00233]